MVQSWPDAAGAYSGPGRALADVAQPAAAEAAFRDALRLRPDLTDARRNLADLLLENGRLLDAAAQYRELLTRDARLADAHNNLAIALARLGQTAEALREAQIAINLQPDNAEFRANLKDRGTREPALTPDSAARST